MKKPATIFAALVGLAFALITLARWKAGEDVRAEATVADAEKQRVRSFWAAYNQANTLRMQGDFARAAGGYRDALRLDPRHEDSLYYLGASEEELGEYAEAAQTFRQLLEVNPASGRGLGELANTLALLAPGAPADFPEARRMYLRNVEVNREQAGPFLRLGALDLNEGRPDSALQNFRIAAGFGSQEGNFYAGYALFLQKKYREAVPYFLKVLEAYGRDKKIIGRGVLSEGDLLPGVNKPLTPLEKAGLKSLLFLYWTSRQLGGYPAGVRREFQIQPRGHATRPGEVGMARPPFAAARLAVRTSGGREVRADFLRDGRQEVVTFGPGQALRVYRWEGNQAVEVTGKSGLEGISDVWDANAVDYDGDGYPDLYLIKPGYIGAGQNLLFHNNRDGTFSDVTKAASLEGLRPTARACFGNFTGDGRMDLVEVGAATSGRASVRFYRNLGNRFVEATTAAGLAGSSTAVDCAVADYDRDGRPDLLVLYWRREAVLYHNDGRGHFSNANQRAGLHGVGGQSYSALFFDYDRDGLPDLLVTTQAPYEEAARSLLESGEPRQHPASPSPGLRAPGRDTPRLFHNLGQGQFEEVTERLGLQRAYGTMQALAADLDGDGWPDLILVNGSLDATRLEPSVALHNLAGKEFREWFYLPDFDTPGKYVAGSVAGSGRAGAMTIFLTPGIHGLQGTMSAARSDGLTGALK